MRRFTSSLMWVGVLLVSSAVAHADPAALRFDVYMDGERTWSSDRAAVANERGNFTIADGQYTSEGNYTLKWWDVEFHTDPFISVNAALTNNTGVPQPFVVTNTIEVMPPILPTSFLGGSTGYTLTDSNNDGSAQLSTLPGVPLYSGQIDAVGVLSLFADPNSIVVNVAGGSSVASESAGLPGGTIPGPPVITSISIRHEFILSPGDSVSFTSFFIVVPEPGSLLLLLPGAALLVRRQRRW